MKSSGPRGIGPAQFGRGRSTRRALLCAALTIATFAVYARTTGFDFVMYDDLATVIETPQVAAGLSWQGVSWALTHPHLANWHPVTTISHMLDVTLFGRNAGGHHATSILLHVLDTLLVFLLLENMTRATWPSALVAALFGLHPMHVESVAWIAERKDVLSALFWLLAMLAYVRYVERPGPGRYALTLALFALGLMSKPMVVTLPFVLLLLDVWPLRRWNPWTVGSGRPARDIDRAGNGGYEPVGGGKGPAHTRDPLAEMRVTEEGYKGIDGASSRSKNTPSGTREIPANPAHPKEDRTRQAARRGSAGRPSVGPVFPADQRSDEGFRSTGRAVAGLSGLLLEKVPFLVLTIVSSIITFRIQQQIGAVPTVDAFPLGARISNALVSNIRYTLKLIWPTGLSAFYPKPDVWPAAVVAGSAVALVALTVLAIAMGRRRPYLSVGWLWYVGTLVPVIGLVQVGMQSMADRYTYIPSIGLFVAIVWMLAELAAAPSPGAVSIRNMTSAEVRNRAIQRTERASPAKSARRRGEADEYGRTLRDAEPDHPAHGREYDRRSASGSSRTAGPQQPRQEHGRALVFATAACVVLVVLATRTWQQVGVWRNTFTLFENAIAMDPENPVARNVLGLEYAKQGRLGDAIAQLTEAARIKPSASTEMNLALAYARSGKVPEAIQHYEAAVADKPEDAKAQAGLGDALYHEGRLAEATAHYEAALHVDPSQPDVLTNLGACLADQGRLKEAVDRYSDSLRLKPASAETLNNLGAALAGLGRKDEALARYRQAIRLRPGYADARENLANLLLSQKRFEEAIPELQALVQLHPESAAAREALRKAQAGLQGSRHP